MPIFRVKKRHLPNLVTLSRFMVAGAILFDLASSVKEFLFIVGIISDGLDGFLARRWKACSKIGGFLDVLADRSLFYSVIWYLASYLSEKWLHHLFLFPLRDVALSLYWLLWWTRQNGEQSFVIPIQKSMLSGKILTVFQAILVIAFFHEFELGWSWFFSHLFITSLTVIELAVFLY
ncbi:CDP-alcohol phosphatidyltransferase family protein [Candidatus Similichlamydia epinepheli]|uniref:CDP-alcohol phosphatidyltransferase family protein n=1 Tax=Candidatus Similichlamydia epinepheli TaxID=1903953 RepID=UPI001300BCBB|nr:CDP-alcohol phosphatidyltransferase family protein [Candidatus Similichlamydia epinepheli]